MRNIISKEEMQTIYNKIESNNGKAFADEIFRHGYYKIPKIAEMVKFAGNDFASVIGVINAAYNSCKSNGYVPSGVFVHASVPAGYAAYTGIGENRIIKYDYKVGNTYFKVSGDTRFYAQQCGNFHIIDEKNEAIVGNCIVDRKSNSIYSVATNCDDTKFIKDFEKIIKGNNIEFRKDPENPDTTYIFANKDPIACINNGHITKDFDNAWKAYCKSIRNNTMDVITETTYIDFVTKVIPEAVRVDNKQNM